jgi:hypothetical protein
VVSTDVQYVPYVEVKPVALALRGSFLRRRHLTLWVNAYKTWALTPPGVDGEARWIEPS